MATRGTHFSGELFGIVLGPDDHAVGFEIDQALIVRRLDDQNDAAGKNGQMFAVAGR